jgi:multidrug efflux pump subunit AcrA (membrane-fusion protein)
MFATVTFTATAQPEVVVDTDALVLVGDRTYVFVEGSPWSFRRRMVQTGQTQGKTAVVSGGLKEGERVIMENAVLLQ